MSRYYSLSDEWCVKVSVVKEIYFLSHVIKPINIFFYFGEEASVGAKLHCSLILYITQCANNPDISVSMFTVFVSFDFDVFFFCFSLFICCSDVCFLRHVWWQFRRGEGGWPHTVLYWFVEFSSGISIWCFCEFFDIVSLIMHYSFGTKVLFVEFVVPITFNVFYSLILPLK